MEEGVIAPGGTVLCANDRLAFGVVSAAFARGLPVGREARDGLRVAGHDDHPLSRFACPPLTTVAQDVESIGRTALEVLLATVGTDADVAPEPPARETRLEARLVLRESA
jgi:DNA-binding LacI/PurR family transcriptional regulator